LTDEVPEAKAIGLKGQSPLG